MKNVKFFLIILAFSLLFISSCAPEGVTEREYGIIFGLIHGFLLPFELIAKLLDMSYDLYARNNTGFWYWVGYIIGVSSWAGGGLLYRR